MLTHRGRCNDCRRRRTALRKQERAQQEQARLEQADGGARRSGVLSQEMYAWSGLNPGD